MQRGHSPLDGAPYESVGAREGLVHARIEEVLEVREVPRVWGGVGEDVGLLDEGVAW